VRDREKAARNSSAHTIAATSARSSIVDRTSGHTGSPSLPPTIVLRATTVMRGESQKTGRSRAWAFKPK
jgi:hypothetical protein